MYLHTELKTPLSMRVGSQRGDGGKAQRGGNGQDVTTDGLTHVKVVLVTVGDKGQTR